MAEKRTIARPYAKAIFSLASSERATDSWLACLSALAYLVSQRPVASILCNILIRADEKVKFLSDIVGGQFSLLQQNALQVMAKENRLIYLSEIYDLFLEYKGEAEQKLEVELQTAFTLTDESLMDLSRVLSNKFNREVNLKVIENKNLIAGILVRAGSQVFDASLRAQLTSLKQKLI